MRRDLSPSSVAAHALSSALPTAPRAERPPRMTPEPDPIPPSSLPPVMFPRHGVPDDPMFGQAALADQSHIVEVDRRVTALARKVSQRTIAAGVVIVIVALAMAVLIVMVSDQGEQLGQVQARQIAADAERARVTAVHQDGICAALTALRTEADQLSFPNTTAYDRLTSQLVAASARVGCP